MQGPSVLRVRFFREESGREIVREWLKAFPTQERRKIGADIRSIQFRWPVGLPWARPMGEGMWEVRSNLRDRIARILFIIEGGEMILLHGIIKKTEKTPPSDLALARAKARKFREQVQRK